MSLPWKHAIVVGASSGIGEALARRLAKDGCRVAMVARRKDSLDRLADELNSAAGSTIAFTAAHDVANRGEVPFLFQELAKELGGLDAIFYAAGVMPTVAVDEYNTEKDAMMMEVNTIGAMAWLNQAAVRFERTKRGTIVGISSIAGDRGRRGSPAYGTSKAALNAFLESLRNRLARFGVKVVTIKPGFIDTEMTQGLPGLFWLISADRAAELIIAAARAGRNVAYIPGRWRIVGMVVRAIPSFLFRRLSI
ncbi:MAG: short-chain dehydrogenase [Chlorobi bacterium]|nr:short-chain dehydrogenase [Chlorobiota bacterium]